MSKYTTEVRFICENASGFRESKGYNDVEDILNECWNKVMPTSFPIFDEDYRKPLCKKILKHFYTREIGYETVGVWKLKLSARLDEIMPYYNQLYESALLEFNPLYDTEYEKRGQRLNDGRSNANGTSKVEVEDNIDTDGTNSRDTTNKFSDTPQGGLSGVETGTYLTNATIQNEYGTSHNETDRSTDTDRQYQDNKTINNQEDYYEKIYGKVGNRKTYSAMLMEFRETFLNIDMMVINDLNSLFMGLWE